MSAQPVPAPQSSGSEAQSARNPREARVVRARLSARERVARIIASRELLVGMARNDLKIKYKNSVLGFAWSLLNPLLYLVVFYIAFEKILGSGIPSFPIFLLSGLLVWNLFSAGLGAATGSVVANSGLVKKVSFPREILPLAAIGSTLMHFFLQSIVLFAVLAVVRWNVAWSYMPLVPVALIALLLLTASLGILFSALNVYLRDTSHFLELALLAWFWVTPIVYSYELVGSRDGWFTKVWMANPVTPIVVIFQRAIYGVMTNPDAPKGSQQILPDWPYWGYVAYLGLSFAVGAIVMALAIYVFGRSEANFAEEL
jgi:ABC-2 type transport system permease protein